MSPHLNQVEVALLGEDDSQVLNIASAAAVVESCAARMVLRAQISAILKQHFQNFGLADTRRIHQRRLVAIGFNWLLYRVARF